MPSFENKSQLNRPFVAFRTSCRRITCPLTSRIVMRKLAGVLRKLIVWLAGSLRTSLRPVILYGFGVTVMSSLNRSMLTTGGVTVNGGVAPLIEITGGFVDDLTVRDNVYLTAGLHGMKKHEIDERFTEIVEFAEIGEFLDTPYKHLSSGMKVRIAFSVVSRLEEPIILVDEVLAVGDKGFKEKCYRRIEELLAGGRTLFFVSHNEKDLRRFCTRGLYLDKGELVLDASITQVLSKYNKDYGLTS